MWLLVLGWGREEDVEMRSCGWDDEAPAVAEQVP
jgi:hypothetical protein